MKTILVPTDFSANAEQALAFALQLAGSIQANVHLLHAVSASKNAGKLMDLEGFIIEEKQKELSALLQKFASQTPTGVQLEGSVQSDYVVDAVINTADQVGAGLIVTGTEGASGLKKWLVGSTTNAIIQNTKLPVLAVPSNKNSFSCKKICLALDLSKTVTTTALQPAINLAAQHGAELQLLQVVKEIKTVSPQLNPELEAALQAAKINYRSYQTVAKATSEIDDAILKFAKESQSDLVCVLNQSEQRSWWQNLFHTSVSEEIAYQTEIPLLVLHS